MNDAHTPTENFVHPSADLTNTRKWTVYERLKQAILDGELRPGQQLVETVLAEWCGVSRTPIREALTRLEQDGIVVRNDRGMHVRVSDPQDVLDLYETRIALESTAARMAAERRTFHDLLQMEHFAQDMVIRTPSNSSEMTTVNDRFHSSIWRATHNRSIIDLLERLSLHRAHYPATTLSFPGRWERACQQHIAIVEAIRSQNKDDAASLATDHFTESRDILLKIWTAEYTA